MSKKRSPWKNQRRDKDDLCRNYYGLVQEHGMLTCLVNSPEGLNSLAYLLKQGLGYALSKRELELLALRVLNHDPCVSYSSCLGSHLVFGYVLSSLIYHTKRLNGDGHYLYVHLLNKKDDLINLLIEFRRGDLRISRYSNGKKGHFSISLPQNLGQMVFPLRVVKPDHREMVSSRSTM